MNADNRLELQLRTFIASRRRMAFDWQRNNCAFFCADWVKEITGIDPAMPWRNGIIRKEDADAVLASHGGMRKVVESLLGEGISPLQAVPGDIVLAPIADGKNEGVGICVGPYAAFVGDDTLTRIDMSAAVRAWKVG